MPFFLGKEKLNLPIHLCPFPSPNQGFVTVNIEPAYHMTLSAKQKFRQILTGDPNCGARRPSILTSIQEAEIRKLAIPCAFR